MLQHRRGRKEGRENPLFPLRGKAHYDNVTFGASLVCGVDGRTNNPSGKGMTDRLLNESSLPGRRMTTNLPLL